MKHPKVFISYSWDTEQHKGWVRNFAARLRSDGVDVTLDQWHLVEGDQLSSFMEAAIRDNEYVLIICTPQYKIKADSRQGGVGYEGDIITAQRLSGGHVRKFIPILRAGTWDESLPTGLGRPLGVDFRSGRMDGEAYDRLLHRIHRQNDAAPPIGPIPNRRDRSNSDGASAKSTQSQPPSDEPHAIGTHEGNEGIRFRNFMSRLKDWFSQAPDDTAHQDQQILAKEVVDAMKNQENRARTDVALRIAEVRRIRGNITIEEESLRNCVNRIELSFGQGRDDLALILMPLALELEHKILLMKQGRARAAALEKFHENRHQSLKNAIRIAEVELSALLETDLILKRLHSSGPSDDELQSERYNAFRERWRDYTLDQDMDARTEALQQEALREFRESPEGIRLVQLQVRDERVVHETLRYYRDRFYGRHR